LGVTAINEHGLLYTWQGSDPQLKPLLFMAHSDVNIIISELYFIVETEFLKGRSRTRLDVG
jgi:hypothetical protein